MAIDEDAPHVKVEIDPSEFEKGLQGLDERFKNSIKKMEKTLNDFKRDAQKAFDELMNGQPTISTSSSSKTSETKSNDTSTKRERKDFEKNVIAQEERAFNQRKEQLKKQDEFIKNSKDMVLAIGALATGGMGAKALLDFSHNIGRLQNFLNAVNAKVDTAYAYRNELRNHGAEDGEIWGAFQSISDNLVNIQEYNGGNLPSDTQFAYNTLSKYNPNLQIGHRDKALTVDEQMKELSVAAKAYQKANPQLNEAQVTKTIADAIGGSKMAAQALLKSNFNFSKADLKKAKEEADAAKKNQEIDKEWQKLKIQLEIELAKAMAANAPEIIAVLKALTNFMTNNGQWVMAAGLIFSFGAALGGIILPLKMAINLLRMAGVFKGGWKASKWAGNKLLKKADKIAEAEKINKVKSLARKEIEQMAKDGKNITRQDMVDAIKKARKTVEEEVKIAEQKSKGLLRRAGGAVWDGTKWVTKHPSEVAGKGLKLGAKVLGPAAIAYDLMNPDATASDNDYEKKSYEQSANSAASRRVNDKIRRIEQALNVTHGLQDGKIFITDKKGNWIWINPDDTIENIKRDLERKTNKTSSGGFLEWMFPSAHAQDPHYSPRAGGRSLGGKVNNERVKEAFDILTRKDQYGSLDREQAIGMIGNLMGESTKRLDPHIVGDRGLAYGLGQWHPDRQANFKRLFGHDIRQSTFAEQVQFIKWELQNTHKFAGDKIKRARDANEATTASVKYYEIPSDIAGQSIERMKNISSVRQALMQPYMQRPSIPQLKQAQMMTTNNHRTANVNNTMGGVTINLHGSNASPQGVVDAMKSGVKFPNVNAMDGMNTVS